MTKRERVLAAIACAETDRPPYSFWYHFPGGDRADEAFVRNEVEFALRYDVDLLKVMHDAPFDLPGGVETVTSADGFAALPVIEPRRGSFGRHLEALRAIRERLPDDRPMVDTVFDPYSYGDKITNRRLGAMLAEEPEAARAGLASITESLVRWTECCLEVVDGIFLACGAASAAAMAAEDYKAFILPLDVRIMEAAASRGKANVLHIHGQGSLHFDMLAECPAQIVNWSDRTTDVTLSEARARLPERCLAGGIDEVAARDMTPGEMAAQVRDAVGQVGVGLIVASGCAVATDTPWNVLAAIGAALKGEAVEGNEG